jgi:hypothetical protein
MTALISEPAIAATAPRPEGAVGAGLLPARPPAAQAHALRAAAMLIERAGVAGLSITVDDRIDIQVSAALAGLPARAGAVAALAAASCRFMPATASGPGFLVADGHLAGHDVHIFTAVDGGDRR